jgi:hypothetical protein
MPIKNRDDADDHEQFDKREREIRSISCDSE